MSRTDIHKKIHFFATIMLACLLPFGKLIPLPIILMLLNWLIEAQFRSKFKKLLTHKFLVILMIFYVAHILGLLHTENMTSGLFDLEVKMSLFILPLIFGSSSFSKDDFAKIRILFVFSCVAAALFLISKAIFFYYSSGEKMFSYTSFSTLLHPSYFAMYLNLALVFCWYEWKSPILIKNMLVLVLTMFFLVVIVILCASKMALFNTILLASIACFSLVYRTFNKWFAIVSVLVLISCSFSAVLLVPSLKNRVHWMFEALSKPVKSTSTESSAIRLNVWKSALDLIAEKPLLGYGTGDVKDVLTSRYKLNGMTSAYEHQYNAHNAFLQNGIALGFVSMFILIALIFAPFVLSKLNQNILFLLFCLIMLFNFLVESMLDRQAGVVFFAFFYSLLFVNFAKNRSTLDKINSEK
jgi:O-antigen ligase